MRCDQESPLPRRMAFAALLLAAVCAAAPAAVLAGVNEWTQIGPDGGALYCDLAVAPSDPSVVYAIGATYFRSVDNGASWESTGARVDPTACSLSVDAADPRRLYSIQSNGFVRSLDGGATWTPSNDGLPTLPSHPTVAIDMHAADFLIFVSGARIYRSLDRGDSWQEISSPVDASPRSVFVDPAAAGRPWLLSAEGGIFTSSDFGDHWVVLNEDLPETGPLYFLEFDPNHFARLYLSTDVGVFRSLDAGAHWSPIQLPGSLSAVGPDSSLYSIWRVGESVLLYRSLDAGDSWQSRPSPFAFSPNPGGVGLQATPLALFALGSLDLRRSIDGGSTWALSTSGLWVATLRGLELDRQSPEVIYGIDAQAQNAERLVRSRDRGATWQRAPVLLAEGRAFLTDVAVDPHDSRHLLATSAIWRSSNLNGLLSSEDDGASWTFRDLPGRCLRGSEIAFDPLRPGRVWLSAGLAAPLCGVSCPNGVSDDAGESWRCFDLVDPEDRALHLVPSPFVGDLILAIGTQGIYRSTNSGEDWSRVAEPPAFTPSYSELVWASADDAYATSANYEAPDDSGLFVSHDAGATWQRADPFPDGVPEHPWLGNLAVDPFRPGSVYALSKESLNEYPREVIRSNDGGLTWSSISGGLLGWPLSDLRVDPVTPNRLYVSADGGGILAYDVQEPEPCVPSATALCITDGRFRIESLWRDFTGHSGVGHAVPLASDTGSFWFFDPENLELFVKEIDGTDYNSAFWTFYGALSNVEFTVLATDTATGAQHGYFNPSRRFASLGDIESFPQDEALVSSTEVSVASAYRPRIRPLPQRSTDSCVPNVTTLCLQGGRFAASVTWRDFVGRRGVGKALPLTPDTGSFWFFDAGIHELAVKVIDGRGTNDAFWVFYGSLSNVEFELTVVDTETGDTWTRENPLGTFASNGDIEAFPQAP